MAIAALVFCLPVAAQEQNAWQFGSLPANSSVYKPDDQQVYEVLLKRLDRWNAHDIEGYMQLYWKSPELLVIAGSEEFKWQSRRRAWRRLQGGRGTGYPSWINIFELRVKD